MSGTISRICVTNPPSRAGTRIEHEDDEPFRAERIAPFAAVINRIRKWKPSKSVVLRLSPEAAKYRREFYNALEKEVGYGGLYEDVKDIVGRACSLTTRIEEEADKHRSALFKTYKGLRAWQKETGNLVKIIGVIRTQCGRTRDFNREQEGYRFTAALNLPIQGAAAEITLRAITRLTPLLSDECRLVNVIHDEILLEIIEPRVQEVADKAKEAMEAAFLDVFPKATPYLKGLVEAKIGKNWAETK